MNAVELTRLQLELECKGLDANGCLVRIPGPYPDDIPLFYVTRHAGGVTRYLRCDLPSQAGEAWVRTLPQFRLRGYARQVTAAWASDLLERGKTAFYSHAIENTASGAVASSLGLNEFITGIAYS